MTTARRARLVVDRLARSRGLGPRADPLRQAFHGPVAHLGRALAQGRERRVDVGREGDIVEPDDADIARHRPAPPAQGAQRPDRHQVVVGEDRGRRRRPVQEFEHRRLAPADERCATGDRDRLGARPGRLEGVADAGQPLRRVDVPWRRHQVAEPPMPEVQEVLGGQPAAGPIVGLDGRQVDVDGGRVDQHHRER